MKEFDWKKDPAVVGLAVVDLCSWGMVSYDLTEICGVKLDDNFASTIITIHITVSTLFIATLALLSGVFCKSYWGISVYSYILDLKYDYLKFKYIGIFEGILLFIGMISYLLTCNSLLFGCCVASMSGVAYFIIQTSQMLFKTDSELSEEIADCLRKVIKNNDDYDDYCKQFIKYWIHQVPYQSNLDFEKAFKLFIDILFTIRKKTKDLNKLNDYSFEIAQAFLSNDNVFVKERGVRFIVDFYKEFSDKSNISQELTYDIDLIYRVQAKLQNVLLYHLSSVFIQEQISRQFFMDTIKVSILCCKNNKDSNIKAINGLAKSLGVLRNKKEKIAPYWYKNIIKAGRFDDNDEVSGDNQKRDLFYKCVAEFDFNVCYGYLVNGLTDCVKDSIFPENDGIHDYSIKIANRIFFVHCFMYYVAYREDCNKYGCNRLQSSIKKLICDQQIINFMNSFLWKLSQDNSSFLTKKLYEEMKRVLNNKIEFLKDGCTKVPIIETVVRDYYLFMVLYSYTCYRNNESIGNCIDINNFCFKSTDQSFFVANFAELYRIFEHVDYCTAQKKANNLFACYINEKPQLIINELLKEAKQEQEEYEKRCADKTLLERTIKTVANRHFYNHKIRLMFGYGYVFHLKFTKNLVDTKNIQPSVAFVKQLLDIEQLLVINQRHFGIKPSVIKVTNVCVQIQKHDINDFVFMRNQNGLYEYLDENWDSVCMEQSVFEEFIKNKWKQIVISIDGTVEW